MSGDSPYKYIRAFGSDLFLSTNAEDVRQALDQQVAAATLIGRLLLETEAFFKSAENSVRR